eukprot:TRINITY_DN36350_c0_g1_i2.p1 TRINITY_DN36350_c0_g1~~TRINITY_DN36350_c0_g1_i2.p1  ORF type:complete len:455 (-),score=122.89 TRINITY_DN36350_c0_g1_i2:459-1769(-)
MPHGGLATIGSTGDGGGYSVPFTGFGKTEDRRRIRGPTFRSCGLGVLQSTSDGGSSQACGVPPALGAATDAEGRCQRLLAIHGATASQNARSARQAERLEAPEGDASPTSSFPGRKTGLAKGRGALAPKRLTNDSAQLAASIEEALAVDNIDSQALAAELDSVASSLRMMLSDAPEKLDVARFNRTQADNEDEEGDELDDQRKRLLRYRYVRKIEEPPPPLQPFEDLPPEKKPGTDKIDKNRRGTVLACNRTAHDRAAQRNQVFTDRVASARRRREEAETTTMERLVDRLAEKENKVVVRGKAESQAKKAAQRDQRLQEAQRRREEQQVAHREKVLAEFAGKEARGGGSSSAASPRGRGGGASENGEEVVEEAVEDVVDDTGEDVPRPAAEKEDVLGSSPAFATDAPPPAECSPSPTPSQVLVDSTVSTPPPPSAS